MTYPNLLSTSIPSKDISEILNAINFINDKLPDLVTLTEEELNSMCDAAEEKEKCREYNLREVEYYNKRALLDLEAL